MNATIIITDVLRSIPEKVRRALYIVYALVVVGEAICRIMEADLAYDKIDQILVYVGGYLGVQAGANATDPKKEEGGDHALR